MLGAESMVGSLIMSCSLFQLLLDVYVNGNNTEQLDQSTKNHAERK